MFELRESPLDKLAREALEYLRKNWATRDEDEPELEWFKDDGCIGVHVRFPVGSVFESCTFHDINPYYLTSELQRHMRERMTLL